MRAHLFAVLLLLVAHNHVCAARQLRQLAVQCPAQLAKPVQDYMKSAKYKDAVAKACVKRANPDCYMDCNCAAYSTAGFVLSYEGVRNYPALYEKYGSACLLVFTNQVLETVLPPHVSQENGRRVCLDKATELFKSASASVEKAAASCPALADLVKEKRAQRALAKP